MKSNSKGKKERDLGSREYGCFSVKTIEKYGIKEFYWLHVTVHHHLYTSFSTILLGVGSGDKFRKLFLTEC